MRAAQADGPGEIRPRRSNSCGSIAGRCNSPGRSRTARLGDMRPSVGLSIASPGESSTFHRRALGGADWYRVKGKAMTWSAALNVTLGLILAYLVFSVAASRINEFIASKLQLRADALERALYTLLGGTLPSANSAGAQANQEPVVNTTDVPQLSAAAVKGHPIIAAFDSQAGKGRRSSYLPSRAVSAAILDILAPPAVILLDAIKANVPAPSDATFSQLRVHPDPTHFAAFAASLPATSTITVAQLAALQHAIDGDVLAQARAAVEDLP